MRVLKASPLVVFRPKEEVVPFRLMASKQVLVNVFNVQ